MGVRGSSINLLNSFGEDYSDTGFIPRFILDQRGGFYWWIAVYLTDRGFLSRFPFLITYF